MARRKTPERVSYRFANRRGAITEAWHETAEAALEQAIEHVREGALSPIHITLGGMIVHDAAAIKAAASRHRSTGHGEAGRSRPNGAKRKPAASKKPAAK